MLSINDFSKKVLDTNGNPIYKFSVDLIPPNKIGEVAMYVGKKRIGQKQVSVQTYNLVQTINDLKNIIGS